MRDIERCIACGSHHQSVWLEPTFHGGKEEASQYFLAFRKGVVRGRIMKCDDCGFTFTSPQFLPSEYDEIYAAAPRPVVDDEMAAANSRRTARIAKVVRRFVGAGEPLCDFGAGEGSFLRALNDPNALGFEVGEPREKKIGASRYIQGRFLDLVGKAPFSDGAFKAFVALDVFEHLPDLHDYIAGMARCLSPGGFVFATVPNIDSRLARLMGAKWNMVLLEHLWYFSPKTLRLIMEQHGFTERLVVGLQYDAPVSHIVRRVGQTFGLRTLSLPASLSQLVIPAPAGLMLGVYQLGSTASAS